MALKCTKLERLKRNSINIQVQALKILGLMINPNLSRKEDIPQNSTNKRSKARTRSTFDAINMKDEVMMPQIDGTIK